MVNVVDFVVYAFWITLVAGVIYTAIESPIRPLQNWLSSWRDSFRYPLRFWVAGLVILLIFAAGQGVDFMLKRQLKLDPTVLKTLAVSWQVVSAGLLAFIAVRVHQWAALHPFDNNRDRGRFRYARSVRRELWAAAIGAAVVLIMFGLDTGMVALIIKLPKEWIPLAATVMPWVRALVFAPLALIRPCLSLGARKPVRTGFIGFSRRALSFFIWISVIGWPLGFAQFAGEIFSKSAAVGTPKFWGVEGGLVLFNIFNWLAFEMTTLRYVRDLAKKASEDFAVGVDQHL